MIYLILFISLSVYIIFLLIFYSGIIRKKDYYSFKRPMVSVIIAARNEEKNLPNLLTYLKNQTYPKNLYEVIIADDDSIDKTQDIVKSFQNNWENLIYLKINDRNKHISPKKNALSKAIKESRGELLLLTDADCFVSRRWINSMVSNFEDNIDMVCGFSQTKIDNWIKAKIYEKFEYFDFIVMYFAAAGSISKGLYFSCSGQNIAYRKKSFYEVGGFKKVMHIQSGDDVNLLQLFRKNKKKVIFSFKSDSYVYTRPISSTKALLNQRVRWASNYKYQTSLNPLFFIYLTFTFILIVALMVMPFFDLLVWLGVLLTKMFFDFLFIKKAFNVFRLENSRLKFFPIWFFMQPIYIFIVSIMGIFEVFSWKK